MLLMALLKTIVVLKMLIVFCKCHFYFRLLYFRLERQPAGGCRRQARGRPLWPRPDEEGVQPEALLQPRGEVADQRARPAKIRQQKRWDRFFNFNLSRWREES